MIIVIEEPNAKGVWHATFFPSKDRQKGTDAMGMVAAKSLKLLADEIENVKDVMKDDGTIVIGPTREK